METKQTYIVTGAELVEKRRWFLQGRCKEDQYFGMKNIASWLMLEREHVRPRDIEAWTRIIQCNADMKGSDVGKSPLPELMHSFGMNLDEVNISQDELSSIGNLQDIRDIVDDVIGELNEPYITDSGLFFLSPDSKQVLRFDGNKNGGTFTTKILRSDVLKSALLSWKYSHLHHQPLTSKRFLCSWLERRIKYVLDEAGKEFDEAVAVSEDGTKIVTADRVMLSRCNRTLQLCGRSLFVENKIRQHSNLVRDNKSVHLKTSVTRENIFPAFMGRFNMCVFEHWQQFFTVIMPTGDVEKWLWCHIGEDDFPEGGTPFKL